MSDDYKNAGVSIEAGEETVDNIKSLVKSTFNKNVLSGIGHFGAFYELDVTKYVNPVLVSSVDGVGTKLKIAVQANIHDTIGQDLVNHCVNDIAVCGAKPLFFLDYMAFGKLNPTVAGLIVQGFAQACKENGAALIGGETAEMPGLYSNEDYDLSGTIVGIVEKKKIIDGSKIQRGDILIGFESNGLHTNGYSLARKVLLSRYKLNENIEELNNTLDSELLKVHKSYLKIIQKIISEMDVKAFSHITGGGIIGNTKRVIQGNLKLVIDWKAWDWPPIFKLIQKTGNIENSEMQKVFNLGIGLVAIINEKDIDKISAISSELNEKYIILGKVE